MPCSRPNLSLLLLLLLLVCRCQASLRGWPKPDRHQRGAAARAEPAGQAGRGPRQRPLLLLRLLVRGRSAVHRAAAGLQVQRDGLADGHPQVHAPRGADHRQVAACGAHRQAQEEQGEVRGTGQPPATTGATQAIAAAAAASRATCAPGSGSGLSQNSCSALCTVPPLPAPSSPRPTI